MKENFDLRLKLGLESKRNDIEDDIIKIKRLENENNTLKNELEKYVKFLLKFFLEIRFRKSKKSY